MGKTHRIFLIFMFVMTGSCCFARQISFQIVQHDLSCQNVTEQSNAIENEVMNCFFDKGYIVTNSEASVSESDGQDETLWQEGFGEAFDGYSDYFVQIKINYMERESKMNGRLIKDVGSVDYKITSVQSGEDIGFDTIRYELSESTKFDARIISSDIVKQINKAIKVKA